MNVVHRLLALGLVLVANPAWAGEDISKVNGRIVVEAGRQCGDLNTVNGRIDVGQGARAEHVKTVNGRIVVGARAQTLGLSTVNGDIEIGPHVTVDGRIRTVNGSVFVDRSSEVSGDVQTTNGSIGLIETQLKGGIDTVNGDITVGVGSHVSGGITLHKLGFSLSYRQARKPRVVIGPYAVVDGDLRFDREVTLYVQRTAKIGSVSGATVQRFDGKVAPGR